MSKLKIKPLDRSNQRVVPKILSPNIQSQLVFMSPEWAEKLLAMNERNRQVSKIRIAQKAQQMLRGEWAENGMPIFIDEDGYIIDGGHRIHAIAESGCGQWLFVTTNVNPKAFPTFDIQKKRTLANTLSWAGVHHSQIFATALSTLDNWMRQSAEDKFLRREEKAKKDTFTERLDFFLNHEDEFEEIFNRTKQYKKGVIDINHGVVIAMIFYLRQWDEDADSYSFDFFNDLFEKTKRQSAYRMAHLLHNELLHQKLHTSHRYKTDKKWQVLLWTIKEYKHKRIHDRLEMPSYNMFRESL